MSESQFLVHKHDCKFSINVVAQESDQKRVLSGSLVIAI